MVDRASDEAEYVVLSFGGFLGIGSNYYPLPWNMLEYDSDQGGYVADLDKDKLDEAPHFSADEESEFNETFGQEIQKYYEPLG